MPIVNGFLVFPHFDIAEDELVPSLVTFRVVHVDVDEVLEFFVPCDAGVTWGEIGDDGLGTLDHGFDDEQAVFVTFVWVVHVEDVVFLPNG